jgi:hypothetical protein
MTHWRKPKDETINLCVGLTVVTVAVGSGLVALITGEWRYLLVTALCYLMVRGAAKG